MRYRKNRKICQAGLIVLLGGCGIIPDQRMEYEKATSIPPLEIPPELKAPATNDELALPELPDATRYSDSHARPTETKAVLPIPAAVRLMRERDQRWLVVAAPPEQLWDKLHAFWQQQGFPLKEDDAKNGILVTDWLENRANIPQSGLRALFGKILDRLYDSSTRDRFRVRLERGADPTQTEVYLSHQGIEEVVHDDTTVWQSRPRDPEIEALMLQRLMVFLGVKEEQAQALLATKDEPPERARLSQHAGNAALILAEDFPRAWRHTGLALDQIGFTVEDRDRSQGIYYVRYNDPLADKVQKKGFWARLAFWRGADPPHAEQYQIYFQGQDAETVIQIRNKNGESDNSPTGLRILNLLHEKLR